MSLIKFAGGTYALLSTDSKPIGVSGEALREIDTLKGYFWLNGSWQQEIGAVTGTMAIFREKYVTTGAFPSGTSITIPNGRTYVTGSRRLDVWAGGLYKFPDSGFNFRSNDYFEQNSTSIGFNFSLPSGIAVEWAIYN